MSIQRLKRGLETAQLHSRANLSAIEKPAQTVTAAGFADRPTGERIACLRDLERKARELLDLAERERTLEWAVEDAEHER